jgi:hypothetical protein
LDFGGALVPASTGVWVVSGASAVAPESNADIRAANSSPVWPPAEPDGVKATAAAGTTPAGKGKHAAVTCRIGAGRLPEGARSVFKRLGVEEEYEILAREGT